MGQRLIGLPIEVGLRAARLGLRAAKLPLEVIGALRGQDGPAGRGGAAVRDEAPPSTRDEARADIRPQAAPGRPAPVRREPPVRSPNGTTGSAAVPTPSLDGGAVEAAESEHVSEEPNLVAESADQGAEDGAHAEIDVAEPWDGYSRMTAREVEQRLGTATAEEVAVVRLYEATHKARQSVLRATERAMTRQAAERRRPG